MGLATPAASTARTSSPSTTSWRRDLHLPGLWQPQQHQQQQRRRRRDQRAWSRFSILSTSSGRKQHHQIHPSGWKKACHQHRADRGSQNSSPSPSKRQNQSHSQSLPQQRSRSKSSKAPAESTIHHCILLILVLRVRKRRLVRQRRTRQRALPHADSGRCGSIGSRLGVSFAVRRERRRSRRRAAPL